jgi:hypothetical protein
MLVTGEHAIWHRLAARHRLHEDIDYFIVVTQHMVELESVEFVFQLTYGPTVCRHLWVDAAFLLHDLVDDKF